MSRHRNDAPKIVQIERNSKQNPKNFDFDSRDAAYLSSIHSIKIRKVFKDRSLRAGGWFFSTCKNKGFMTYLPNISLVHFGSFLIGEIFLGRSRRKKPLPNPLLICFGFWPLAFGKQPPVFSSFLRVPWHFFASIGVCRLSTKMFLYIFPKRSVFWLSLHLKWPNKKLFLKISVPPYLCVEKNESKSPSPWFTSPWFTKKDSWIIHGLFVVIICKRKTRNACNCSLILTALRSLGLWSKEYWNKGIKSLCLCISVLKNESKSPSLSDL